MQERTALLIARLEVPEWMATGRTVLLSKDKSKGNEVSNYRPITCLPLMWKSLTRIVADEIYKHLEENNPLPEDEKDYPRNRRGTKDQLLTDKTIMKNSRRRKVRLSMVWIDYQKPYDMIAHSWITKSIEMFGVADNTFHLFSKRMDSWQTILLSGNEELARVNIQSGMFQGEILYLLHCL